MAKKAQELMTQLMGTDEQIISRTVNAIRKFLNSFDEDKTIGSISDKDIEEYARKELEEAKAGL